VKYLKKCKDDLWKRWEKEYLTALRECHNLTQKASKFQPQVRDVVIIKTEEKNYLGESFLSQQSRRSHRSSDFMSEKSSHVVIINLLRKYVHEVQPPIS